MRTCLSDATTRRAFTLALIGCFALTGFKNPRPNFSGTYLSEPQNPDKPDRPVTLVISQSDTALEIAHQEDGRTTTSSFPLDGSEGRYITPTGVSGKGYARLNGSELQIETWVTSPATTRSVSLHTTEHWQLTEDGETLKVHMEVEAPEMSPEVNAAAFQPFTIVYHRRR